MENTASAMASMEKLDHSNQAFPVSEFIDEYDASSGGIYPSHWHREMELQIILAGSARYTVNGETYVVKEGNASILPRMPFISPIHWNQVLLDIIWSFFLFCSHGF